MRKLLFQAWCSKATSGIHTSPDRENVSQELFDHMEDHYQSLIESGMDPTEAQNRAVESMGSAEELAPILAAIHRPFWGQLEYFLKRAIAILALITALALGFFYIENFMIDPILQEFDPDAGLRLSGSIQQLTEFVPDADVQSDGYTLTVERASVWQQAGDSVQDYLNIQIKVTNPRPWAQVPDFSGWYWAVDSLGNYYYSACEDSSANESSINVADYRTGYFSCVQDLWLSPYVSQEAQWIELRYDRAGRNIILRIDLTGGVQP